MKKYILNYLIGACLTLLTVNLNAQQLKDLPVGPNGGHCFQTSVKNQKIELKMDGNQAKFYIINERNENAKLTASAATATILFDYNAEQPAETRQVTITSKNKFEVSLPQTNIPVNFIAFHANFNGDIIEGRFILRDLNRLMNVEPAK